MGNMSDSELTEEMLLENLKVSRAMSTNYVNVSRTVTIQEAIKSMHENHRNCVLVVEDEDFLEGILTYGDARRYQSRKSTDTLKSDSRFLDDNTCLVSSICTREISFHGRTRGLLTCYPDTGLLIAKELMEAKDIKQLPVVKSGRQPPNETRRRLIAILHYDSILKCLRDEISHRKSIHQHRKENLEEITNGH